VTATKASLDVVGGRFWLMALGETYESTARRIRPSVLDEAIDERARGFLRDVVADAVEDSVRIRAREFLGIGMSVRGGPVEVAPDGDRRHCDHGTFEQPRLELVVLLLSLGGSTAGGRSVLIRRSQGATMAYAERRF
jgi:hypothetical protein